MSMKYIIGVDAGGTKTAAAAFDENGKKLLEVIGDYGSVTANYEKGLEHICETVDRLIAQMDGECTYLCIGCAGIETGDYKQKAYVLFREKYNFPVYITNDAMLGLYAALKGEDGILVIAGTGSIGYLKQNGELKRFGGWGHLINDDGSGYTIATKAIRFIAYSFDVNESETALKKAVFEKLGITELRSLIQFVYASSKGDIAALVPVIEKCANEGDPQANEILNWAGERLSRLAIGLCKQYNVTAPKIAISGSVLRKMPSVKETFCNAVKEEVGDFTLIDESFDPTTGGYYIWLEQK